MIIILVLLMILSIAVTNNVTKAIIYSRLAIQGLMLTLLISYNNLFVKPLENGIILYGGMFNIDSFTQSFDLFIIIIVFIITLLTSFNRMYLYSATTHVYNAYKNKHYVTNEYVDFIPFNRIYKKANTIVDKTRKELLKVGNLDIVEYSLITLFVLSGAILLISSIDLISMFLSIELQSYGLYILATLYRDSEYATNSGLTYFLLGGMSSCFILFGSALLYINSGTTSIENIYIINSINASSLIDELSTSIISSTYLTNYVNLSLVMIMVGFLFKVSAAPFHFWSPDVYDGIPTVVTTFVAIVPKISIFIFIIQLILNMELTNIENIITNTITHNISPNTNTTYNYIYKFTTAIIQWKDILIISSLASLVIGSLLGLTQYRIKRLFAYSTINHVGFILLALSIGTIESIQGYIFYILQYTISNINAFFILIVIGSVFSDKYLHEKNATVKLNDINNSPIQLISQLKGYFYENSYLSISLAITLFSFAGIPPLIGFFAKQMVLSAALDKGLVFVTLIAIVSSVIGAVYYLNIINNMFFYDKDTYKNRLEIDFSHLLDLSVLSKLNINTNENTDYNYSYVAYTKINSVLTTIISILTIIIIVFIYMPNEWLRIASILSIMLFKL